MPRLRPVLSICVGVSVAVAVGAGASAAPQRQTQPAAAPPPAAALHDRAFWRSIVEHEYAPPRDATQVGPLVRELSGYLGSPDPELRDEFGYSILTAWIYQKHLVPPEVVRTLAAEWSANLQKGIGSTETDDVFRRSFSALMLSIVVAYDNANPFLDASEVHTLLASALAYLKAERDVRAYDPRKGWMHSAAHTADLLKFLARSRHFDVVDERGVLDAIEAKLRQAPDVFTHGEDERFARAVLSIVNRKDFDADAFAAWVTRATPVRPPIALPDPATLRANQNIINLFAKLEVLLTLQEPAPPAAQTARDALRAALKKLF